MKYLLVFFTLLFIPPSAQAHDELIYAPDICEGTQTDLNICAYKYLKNVDAKLNKFYQLAIERLKNSKTETEKFKEIQRTWIKYRNQTCNFTSGDGKRTGTIWPLIHSMCLINLTEHRIKMIENSFMEALDLKSIEK